MLNTIGAERTNTYQHLAVDKSRLHIPLLFGADVIHGFRTIYPVPLGLAASFDPELVVALSHMAAARGDHRRRALVLLSDGRHQPRSTLGTNRGGSR